MSQVAAKTLLKQHRWYRIEILRGEVYMVGRSLTLKDMVYYEKISGKWELA